MQPEYQLLDGMRLRVAVFGRHGFPLMALDGDDHWFWTGRKIRRGSEEMHVRAVASLGATANDRRALAAFGLPFEMIDGEALIVQRIACADSWMDESARFAFLNLTCGELRSMREIVGTELSTVPPALRMLGQYMRADQ